MVVDFTGDEGPFQVFVSFLCLFFSLMIRDQSFEHEGIWKVSFLFLSGGNNGLISPSEKLKYKVD